MTTSQISSTKHQGVRTIQEIIYREHFLKNALRKCEPCSSSISARNYESLCDDLEQYQNKLHHYAKSGLRPALAAIASSEARSWERDLIECLSQSDCRWERVFRVTHELTQINSLLSDLSADHPELAPVFNDHLICLQAHETFHEKVMSRWVLSERERGNPIDELLGEKSSKIESDWQAVVAELIPTDNSKSLIPADSWRSLETIVGTLLKTLVSPLANGHQDRAA